MGVEEGGEGEGGEWEGGEGEGPRVAARFGTSLPLNFAVTTLQLHCIHSETRGHEKRDQRNNL